ncbi:unnamed protein product, partial [Urochloa humidicola]
LWPSLLRFYHLERLRKQYQQLMNQYESIRTAKEEIWRAEQEKRRAARSQEQSRQQRRAGEQSKRREEEQEQNRGDQLVTQTIGGGAHLAAPRSWVLARARPPLRRAPGSWRERDLPCGELPDDGSLLGGRFWPTADGRAGSMQVAALAGDFLALRGGGGRFAALCGRQGSLALCSGGGSGGVLYSKP